MRKIVFALVFIVLFIIACGQPATNTVKQEQTPAQAAATATPTERSNDPQVTKLFERNSQVKSYSFDAVKFPSKTVTNTYYVRGDYARVKPVDTLTVNRQSIDSIYLNRSDETAVGYCAPSNSCPDPNKAIDMDYSKFNIVMPHEWIEQIKYGQYAGTLTFGNKPVTRVKYQADGKYYEAYVDNYYGMPMRIAIATDPEMTNIVGGYEYRDMAFNTLKDTDVIHQYIKPV